MPSRAIKTGAARMKRQPPNATGSSPRWFGQAGKTLTATRTAASSLLVASLLLVAPGCRNWGNPYPLPNPSRVPPPPTGSYPATGNYYGAPTTTAPAGAVSAAGYQTGTPTTDLSQVSQASYSEPNVWSNQSQFDARGGSFQPAPIEYSAPSNTSMQQQPSLDWR